MKIKWTLHGRHKILDTTLSEFLSLRAFSGNEQLKEEIHEALETTGKYFNKNLGITIWRNDGNN